jgi:hypothetical protein
MKNVTIDPSIRELIGKSRPSGLTFSTVTPVTGRTSALERRRRMQASVCAVSSERTKYYNFSGVISTALFHYTSY